VENISKLNSPLLITTLNNTLSNTLPNIRTPLKEILIYILLNPTTLFIILGTILLYFLLPILGLEGTLIFTRFNITNFFNYYIDLTWFIRTLYILGPCALFSIFLPYYFNTRFLS